VRAAGTRTSRTWIRVRAAEDFARFEDEVRHSLSIAAAASFEDTVDTGHEVWSLRMVHLHLHLVGE
jgi:hypothetical protein